MPSVTCRVSGETREGHTKGSLPEQDGELGCGGRRTERERGERASPPEVKILDEATKQKLSCLMDTQLSTLGIEKGKTRGEKDVDEGTQCVLETT